MSGPRWFISLYTKHLFQITSSAIFVSFKHCSFFYNLIQVQGLPTDQSQWHLLSWTATKQNDWIKWLRFQLLQPPPTFKTLSLSIFCFCLGKKKKKKPMQKLNVTDFAQTLADLPILQFSLKQNKTKKNPEWHLLSEWTSVEWTSWTEVTQLLTLVRVVFSSKLKAIQGWRHTFVMTLNQS